MMHVKIACWVNYRLIAVLCLMLVCLVTPSVHSREIRIVATADGYATDNGPNGVFDLLDSTGDAFYLEHYGSFERRGIVEFDISELAASTELLSVSLEVRPVLVGGSPAEPDVVIHGYTGNGVVELADAQVPLNVVGGQADVTLVETSVPIELLYVQNLLGTTDYLGLSLRVDDQGQVGIWSIDGPSIYTPPPTLVLQIPDILYVDDDAAPGGNGASWATAFNDLQDALDTAQLGANIQVWVASGEYRPTSANDRDATFSLISGVSVYGGFTGTESDLQDRNADPTTNATVLTGDIGVVGLETDNSYSVVTAVDVDATAILDGFTVRDGYADSTPFYTASSSGGGIFVGNASPTVTNCQVMHNKAEAGGGLFCDGNSHPLLSNCDFVENDATLGPYGGRYGGGVYVGAGGSIDVLGCQFTSNNASNGGGGGVYCEQDTVQALLIDCDFFYNRGFRGGALFSYLGNTAVINCVFAGNEASTTELSLGGAVFTIEGRQQFINCTFSDNETSGQGGGLLLAESSVGSLIANCTFTGNSADDIGGGLMVAQHANLHVSNSILWGNTDENGVDVVSKNILDFVTYGENDITVRYSCVQDGLADDGSVFPGVGNVDLDPLMADVTSGNVHLTANSPCVDAGSNGLLPRDEFDLNGDANTNGPIPIDLDRNVRVANKIVDMGAYELAAPLLGDLDLDGDIDLVDYALFSSCITGYVRRIPTDFNDDGVVDVADLRKWMSCLHGPIAPINGSCEQMDVDLDGNVDLGDYAVLQLGVEEVPMPASDECQPADFNGDGNIDLADFHGFQKVFN